MKSESIDHADKPPMQGITRFKTKRIMIATREQGSTWKFSEVRVIKDFGFLFPFPNFMIDIFSKLMISSHG